MHAYQVNTQVMTACLVLGTLAVIFGIAATAYRGLYVVHSEGKVISFGIWEVGSPLTVVITEGGL